jgi:uncharacterized protein (TIGR02001 family)
MKHYIQSTLTQKIAKPLLGLTALFASSMCIANDETSPLSSLEHSLSFATDYVSDGVSQSQTAPALQWNTRYTHDDFYASAFASNVKFLGESGLEADFGIGKIFDFEALTLDLGLLNNFNLSLDLQDDYFWEVYAGITVYGNKSIYVTYSDDIETFDAGKNAKITFEHTMAYKKNWQFSYMLGYADMYRSRLSNSDYKWISASASYQHNQWTASLNVSFTDISKQNDIYRIAQDNVALVLQYQL